MATLADVLDLSYVLWGEREDYAAVDRYLAGERPAPPDEGDEAQARLDAMLGSG